MFPHDTTKEKGVSFSRFDLSSPFSTVSDHPFLLDDVQWRTAEHYYQANKFKGFDYAEKIIGAEDWKTAYDLGNRFFARKVRGWKNNRQLYMTRALFRKVKEYSDVREALLATEDKLILETSQYDYYWGLGRDQRGQNQLGKIWMDIREKLRDQTT